MGVQIVVLSCGGVVLVVVLVALVALGALAALAAKLPRQVWLHEASRQLWSLRRL